METLTDNGAILGIKPHEVFEKLSKEPIMFSNKTKADIFDEKYQVGDVIPCNVIDISDGSVGLEFKNDSIFYYRIKLHNITYLGDIDKDTCVNIRFEKRDENRKPVFNIISYIDNKGKTIDIETIDSYAVKHPLGSVCTVTVTGRDYKGDVRVSHKGFNGKIPNSSYPKGYLDHVVTGKQLECRVAYVDIERQTISFFPVFEIDILPYIKSGEIKNFYCKVLDKNHYNGKIKFEFDGGEIESFAMYHPWCDFLEIGKEYTHVGYYKDKDMMMFYQDVYFRKFQSMFTVGDVVNGKIIYNNGRFVTAQIAGYPCSVNGKNKRLKVGDKYDFTIFDIDESNKKVTINPGPVDILRG